MSLSNEYFDWHLTPRGWVEGTSGYDFGPVLVKPPSDRVLTVRHHDETPVVYRRIQWVEEIWRSDDERLVEKLVAQHGRVPERLPSESPPDDT